MLSALLLFKFLYLRNHHLSIRSVLHNWWTKQKGISQKHQIKLIWLSLFIVTGSGLSLAAVAGICAAVVILLVAAAAGVMYCLKQKKGEYHIQLIEQDEIIESLCVQDVKICIENSLLCNWVCHYCSNRKGGGAKSNSGNINLNPLKTQF